jgi:hypothetical protein
MKFSRKLIYMPGAISLLALYPICMYQLDRWKVFENPLTIEVTWYATDPSVRELYGQQSIPLIEHQIVNLTGDEGNDNIQINNVRYFAREVAAHGDTTKLMRIRIADDVRYERLVQILEVCQKEKVLSYALHQNDCWIFHRRYQKPLARRVPPK